MLECINKLFAEKLQMYLSDEGGRGGRREEGPYFVLIRWLGVDEF